MKDEELYKTNLRLEATSSSTVPKTANRLFINDKAKTGPARLALKFKERDWELDNYDRTLYHLLNIPRGKIFLMSGVYYNALRLYTSKFKISAYTNEVYTREEPIDLSKVLVRVSSPSYLLAFAKKIKDLDCIILLRTDLYYPFDNLRYRIRAT